MSIRRDIRLLLRLIRIYLESESENNNIVDDINHIDPAFCLAVTIHYQITSKERRNALYYIDTYLMPLMDPTTFLKVNKTLHIPTLLTTDNWKWKGALISLYANEDIIPSHQT